MNEIRFLPLSITDYRLPTMNNELYDNLLLRIKEIAAGGDDRDEKLMAICRTLHDEVDHYHWVGFYLVGEDRKELLLGPYLGDPTQHVRIPFGQGVCGLAAEKQRTLMVPDVSRLLNCPAARR